jgi:peptide chain release factor subunit 1
LKANLTNLDSKKNGSVFFFGEHDGRPYRQIIEPPHPVQSFMLKIEREFYLGPLYQMISTDEVYGILVIDLADATLGQLIGTKITTLFHVGSQVQNKHHHGGMSSLRFERLRDDSINEFFKKVAEKCNVAFLDKGLKGLIIGGPAKTKNDFIAGEYLHHELRKIITGTVDTEHTDRTGLEEAVKASEGILSTCQYFQEKRTLERFWTEAGNNGLAVTGLDETIERLKNGQVQTLIVSESLDLEKMEDLKGIADQFDTEVFAVDENEEFARQFISTVMVGGILRYK